MALFEGTLVGGLEGKPAENKASARHASSWSAPAFAAPISWCRSTRSRNPSAAGVFGSTSSTGTLSRLGFQWVSGWV